MIEGFEKFGNELKLQFV